MAEGSTRRHHASAAEWVVAAVSTVLLLAMLGYMMREVIAGSSTPPALMVRADSVIARGGSYLVVFTIRNDGDQTAAAATVKGTLERAGATLEDSEATIDYVPAHSARRGGLVFTLDPGRHALRLRVTGFDYP